MLDEMEVFERRVRERAYQLWQEAGCPENAADEFWHRARDLELRDLNLTPEQLEQATKSNAPLSDAADFA